jgi:hypothetical protein
MNDWLDYDYLIETQPGESEFPALNDEIMCRIEMSPRHFFIAITDNDALLIKMDDAVGLRMTKHSDLFEFDGNRLNFDDWMAKDHPDIGYCWVDQYVIGFADRAAQLAFNNDLGDRVLRSVHLPRPAPMSAGLDKYH